MFIKCTTLSHIAYNIKLCAVSMAYSDCYKVVEMISKIINQIKKRNNESNFNNDDYSRP